MNLQKGQALTEGLVVILGVLTLLVAATWLARLQDIVLYQQHASRFGAFELARSGSIHEAKTVQRFFSGTHAGWRSTSGSPMVPDAAVQTTVSRSAQLHVLGQPGALHESATRLRREWRLQDTGIANVSVTVRPDVAATSGQIHHSSTLAGKDLGFTQEIALALSRHTAILTGAGHTATVSSAHVRAAESDTAWRQVADASYAAGKRVTSVAQPVDAPWNRPTPIFDWFMPWAGKRP